MMNTLSAICHLMTNSWKNAAYIVTWNIWGVRIQKLSTSFYLIWYGENLCFLRDSGAISHDLYLSIFPSDIQMIL